MYRPDVFASVSRGVASATHLREHRSSSAPAVRGSRLQITVEALRHPNLQHQK